MKKRKVELKTIEEYEPDSDQLKASQKKWKKWSKKFFKAVATSAVAKPHSHG